MFWALDNRNFCVFLNLIFLADCLSSPLPPSGLRFESTLLSPPKQVGQAKDELLTSQLIDHLMGESDGMPKVLFPPRGLSRVLGRFYLIGLAFYLLGLLPHRLMKFSLNVVSGQPGRPCTSEAAGYVLPLK